ncbi:MAG: hypothetical protein GX046_00395 [Tissierellia bacterium]|jgi:transcriptional regulator NrdR family protein|nr:hypothetical protein [Tissierellia bacterium]
MDKNQLFEDLGNRLKDENLSARELSQLITSSLPKLYENILGQDKSYVIKRSGMLEEYQCEKFQSSLARASDETNQPLGSGELNVLCSEVSRQAAQMGTVIYTWQLRDLILEILYKNKYYEVYKSYKNAR